MTDYADGQIIVRVALGLGPKDTLPVTDDDPAWTNLTDRVLRYTDDRGRDDPLQEFGPGTATVELDNGDRMLDPSNPDGYLFSGTDPIGLPLCPVKITQSWNGVEYPKFTGYLGPEAWPGDIAPKGPSGTVTLNVMDELGHSPKLPGDIWGIVTTSMRPDWWLRMDVSFVLDEFSRVEDAVTTGWAEILGDTGLSRPYFSTSSLGELGTFSPGLLMSGNHALHSYSLDVMPDGDEASLSTWLWWSSRSVMTTGQSAVVYRMEEPGGGNPRWDVVIDGDDGFAYVTTYDATGTVIDSDHIEPFASTRWDQGDKHLVIARFDSSLLTVWFGGVSVTLNATTVLYESDLVIGPASVDVMVDELAVWRRALNVTNEIESVLATAGYGTFWSGDTLPDRMGRWIEASGRDVTSDDTNEWHFSDYTTEGLWGLLRPHFPTVDSPSQTSVADLYDDIAAAVQGTVESVGGARWATKAGFLRSRDRAALTDATYAEHYADPVHLTDADTILATSEYRHAGVEVTGKRIDRVINSSTIEFYPSGPPPTLSAVEPMRLTKRDQESIDRYGLRTKDYNSAWCNWVIPAALIDSTVARFSQPRQEIDSVRLDPTGTGDDARNLAEWLITVCELEQAVDVTYTPADADAVTVEGLNIQRIAFDWTPERWTVDLSVAAS